MGAEWEGEEVVDTCDNRVVAYSTLPPAAITSRDNHDLATTDHGSSFRVQRPIETMI
jgi:hypothetical protein